MMHRALASASAAAPRRIWSSAMMGAASQKRPLPMSTTNRPFMQGTTDRLQHRQQQQNQQQQQQRCLGRWTHSQYHRGNEVGSSSPGLSFFSTATAVNSNAFSSSHQQHQEEGLERATQSTGDAEYAASSAHPREQEEREGERAGAGAGTVAGAGAAPVGVGAEGGGVSQGVEASVGSSTSAAAGAAATGAAAVGTAEASSLKHTVVRHPPTPGWEYPAVPDGCEPKFAVIRLGNTQYKVTKDDVIVAEKLAGDIGTTLDITDVLLVGTAEATVVGRPVVPGATVRLYVEEQTRDKKVVVYKKRRRKSSKTTQGHRREVTLLRVTDILS